MTATVGEGVALLRAGVDALLGAGLSPLSSVDVTQAFAALETERRRLEAVDHRFIAELTDRGAAGEYGRTSTTDLVATLLRINPGEAKARVERTIDVGPRRTLSGERLAPTFPAVADAVHAGAISAAHVRVITACLDEIPSPIVPTAAPIAEHLLVQTATHCDPATTARTGRELLARLNPDGIEPTDDDIARRRDLTLHHRSNGSARLTGELTAEALAVWTPIIDALSAPVPADPAGEPDDRSAGQRRHDGFVEAGRRLLRSRSLPASGGAPVTVLVTMRAEQFTAGGDGYARTAHGGLISVAELLRMAAEVELTTVVLNPAGGVLSYGRLARLASCDQRRALAARDGGCCFPGCTRPPAWTEAHHVVPWQDGGPTDLDNLCLLCGFHHREFERRGWQVHMRDGVPEWLPPPWLDPHQRPRRNTSVHPADFDFAESA